MANIDLGGDRTDQCTDALMVELKDDAAVGVGKGPFVFYTQVGRVSEPQRYRIYLIAADKANTNTVPDEVLTKIANEFGCPLWRLDFTQFPVIAREDIRTGARDELTVKELTNEVMSMLYSSPNVQSKIQRSWDIDTQSDGTRNHEKQPIVPCTVNTSVERRMSVWQMAIDSYYSRAIDLDCIIYDKMTSVITDLFETKKHSGAEKWDITKEVGERLDAFPALVWYDEGQIKYMPDENSLLLQGWVEDIDGLWLGDWEFSVKRLAEQLRARFAKPALTNEEKVQDET